jgi:tetratricopeptide (TPR) repeat protein
MEMHIAPGSKLKKLLVLAMLLNAASAQAQQPGSSRLDSLLTMLSSAGPDSSKVLIYADVILLMALDHDPRVSQYVEPALTLAHHLQWERGTAKVHASISRMHWSAGEFDEALKQGQEALALYEKLGDRPGMAHQLSNNGQIHLDAGRYTEARIDLQKALDLFTRMGKKKNQAFIHGLLAYLLGSQGDPAAAIKETYAQLKLEEEIGDQYRMAITTSNLAEIQMQLGHLDEALTSLLKSLELLRATQPGDKVNISSIQISIGNVYLRMRRPLEAEVQYRNALSTAIAGNVTTGIGIAYRRLGDIRSRVVLQSLNWPGSIRPSACATRAWAASRTPPATSIASRPCPWT